MNPALFGSSQIPTGMFTSITKTGDELMLNSTQRDVDEFFETEKHFLVEYHNHLKECTIKSDKMTVLHKSLADNYIKVREYNLCHPSSMHAPLSQLNS